MFHGKTKVRNWGQFLNFARSHMSSCGFPSCSDGKESACNAGDPSSVRGLGRREWLPTSVFLPAESPWTEEPGGLQSWGHKMLNTTEQLDTHLSSQCEAKVAPFWLESVRWKCSIVHLALCLCVWLCERGPFGSQDQTRTQVVSDYNGNWSAPPPQAAMPQAAMPLPPTSFPSSQQIIPLLMLIFSSNFLQLSVPQERVWLV